MYSLDFAEYIILSVNRYKKEDWEGNQYQDKEIDYPMILDLGQYLRDLPESVVKEM